MRRNQDETQVTNMAGIRRNLKNLAHNYSDAQVKVREATSNDPWGPSSTLMSEIADLTYNVVAFTEIMQMIWKRLNDHGKNWRHVYKALVLLDYLIKTGSEKVAQQCRENIFAIMTLRDFQYMDDGKDQGLNVREKAKQLVALLREEDKLRAERSRALKAKERFALSHSTSAFGSDTNLDAMSPSSPSFSNSRTWGSSEAETTRSGRSSQNGVKTSLVEAALDLARPQTAGEEELQLQLALAMSREQAEQEDQKRRSDDVRLQLALSQSENEFKQEQMKKKPVSHMEELLDVDLGGVVAPAPGSGVVGSSAGLVTAGGLGSSGLGSASGGLGSSSALGSLASPPPPPTDPWGMPVQRPQSDPWSSVGSSCSITPDPWSPLPPKPGNSNATQPQLSRPPGGFPKKEENVSCWTPSRSVPPVSAVNVQPVDPWSPLSPPTPVSPPLDPLDDFDIITNRNINNNNNNPPSNIHNMSGSPNPFEMRGLGDSLNAVSAKRRSPHSFLGENSALVNLDQLVTRPAPTASNPAHTTPLAQGSEDWLQREISTISCCYPAIANPFSPVGAVNGTQRPAFGTPAPIGTLPQPLIPSATPTPNPFLS